MQIPRTRRTTNGSDKVYIDENFNMAKSFAVNKIYKTSNNII